MKILHHPKNRDAPHLQATWAWVEENRTKYGVITELVNPDDGLDYAKFLGKYWCLGETLINLEHDMLPTNAMIDALLACPHDLCAQAYLIYPVHTALPEPVITHRVRGPNGRLDWIRDGDEWADVFALGLTKFTPKAQSMVPTVPMENWRTLDHRLGQMFPVQCHIHWPLCEHNPG